MFNSDLENAFSIFSIQHLLAILVIAIIVAFIYIYRTKLKESKHFNLFRISLAVLILLQEVSLNIYRIVMNEWVLATSLPFQLCGLGVLTTAIVLFSQNKKLFINTFFIMMIGAFFAILTPAVDKNFGFPHYRYFQFFVSHGLIVINFTFILFVMGYSKYFRYKHLLNNFFVLLGISVFAFLINLLVDGNYLYLMGKPGEDTAFDLFGEHPWYIFNIFLFGIPIFFHLFYFPFFIKNFVSQKKIQRTSG